MKKPAVGRFWRVLSTAERVHSGHLRKVVPAPFLRHPLGVVHILLSYGFEEEPLCLAALLHDTVEHGLMTKEGIANQFGPRVAALVAALSPRSKSSGWRERKADAIERLRAAPDDVIALACADKLDNVLSILEDLSRLGDLVWTRLGRSPEEVAWYYSALAEMFRERSRNHASPAMLLEFVGVVERLLDQVKRRA